MRKFLDYFLAIVALAITLVFYLNFDLEGILWDREEQKEISSQQIEKDRGTDYTGMKAGEGILSLKSKEDWEGMLNEVDYATVTPKSIQKTDVYSLAKWADHYNRRRNGATGRKRAEVRKSFLDYSANYSPYYIIELEDGTKILAQMNRGLASKIKKGKKIQLPLGQKIGFSETAKKQLASVCKAENVSTDYVLYTINTTWAKEKENIIFFGKAGASIVVCIVLAVLLEFIGGMVLPKTKEE